VNNSGCSFRKLNECSCNYLPHTGSAGENSIGVSLEDVEVVFVGVVSVVDESRQAVGKNPKSRVVINLSGNCGKVQKTLRQMATLSPPSRQDKSKWNYLRGWCGDSMV
jgi:hypothetical protein